MALQIGMIESYDKKKAEEKEKSGGKVTLAVGLENLYEELTLQELRHQYNHTAVIFSLKRDLALALGKIQADQEPPQPQQQPSDEHQGGA